MKISHLLVFFALLISFSSCFKESPTVGIITLYDSDGNRVPNAIVTSPKDIVGVTQTNVVSTLVSDYNGQTEHV